VHGEGAAKIRWGEHGDFDRCTRQLMEHAHFTPEQAHGYCNLAHHAALGFYPATHAAMEKGHQGRAARVSTYTRSYALEDISIRSDGSGRTVDAYAAVFNIPARVRDQDGEYEEVIDPAAFNRTLDHARRSKSAIPVLFNHGMTLFGTPSERYSVPIGVSEEVRVDGNGLFTRSRFHKTQAAEDILEAIRDGSITGYSFRGQFLRSDPLVPRGGFRRSRDGSLSTVRRTESSLDEYGPGTFAVYKEAAIVGMRAEQAALMLAALPPAEMDRLATIFRSGTSLGPSEPDPPEPGTPEKDSGSATEDPPVYGHSGRSPKEVIRSARAAWIVRHGGDA
jgi:HK97 family phage prohead protease